MKGDLADTAANLDAAIAVLRSVGYYMIGVIRPELANANQQAVMSQQRLAVMELEVARLRAQIADMQPKRGAEKIINKG